MVNEIGRKNFFDTLKKRIKKIFKLTSWSGFVKMFFREKHIDWVEYVIEDVDYPNGIISLNLKIRYNTEKEIDMLTNKQIQQIIEVVTEKVTENIVDKITDNVVEKITENAVEKISEKIYKDLEKKIDEKFNSLTKNKSDDK